MPSLQLAAFALLGLTLVVALVTDLRERRIPDWLTYPAMLLALGLRAALEGVGDLETGLLSGVAGLAAAGGWFALFAAFGRGMGWGDVKLAAVVGACLGIPLAGVALVCISLAGAVQAAAWLALKRGKHIPYAVAIAAGSACAMWWR